MERLYTDRERLTLHRTCCGEAYTGRERLTLFIGLAVERLFTGRERLTLFIGLAVERLFTGRERLTLFIGLAVERLFTGRERLTLCSPFRGAAHSLLASGEGRKRKVTSNQTPTDTPRASTAIWLLFVTCAGKCAFVMHTEKLVNLPHAGKCAFVIHAEKLVNLPHAGKCAFVIHTEKLVNLPTYLSWLCKSVLSGTFSEDRLD